MIFRLCVAQLSPPFPSFNMSLHMKSVMDFFPDHLGMDTAVTTSEDGARYGD